MLCGGLGGEVGLGVRDRVRGVESEHKNCIDGSLIFVNSFFTVIVWNLTEMALRGLK